MKNPLNKPEVKEALNVFFKRIKDNDFDTKDNLENIGIVNSFCLFQRVIDIKMVSSALGAKLTQSCATIFVESELGAIYLRKIAHPRKYKIWEYHANFNRTESTFYWNESLNYMPTNQSKNSLSFEITKTPRCSRKKIISKISIKKEIIMDPIDLKKLIPIDNSLLEEQKWMELLFQNKIKVDQDLKILKDLENCFTEKRCFMF